MGMSGASGRSRIQGNHALGDNLGPRVGNVVFVVPAPGADPAFDIDSLSFCQGLLTSFGQGAPGNDVEPVRVLLKLVIGRHPSVRCHDAKRGHGFATGRVAHFGCATQVANQRHSVQSL